MRIVLAAVPWSGMVNSYPPLGLGYLAATLRTDPTIETKINLMDFGLLPGMSPKETVEAILEDGPPDLLGLSCLTHNFQATLDVVRLVKKAHPEVMTVLGGPHPSVDPEGTAACEGVDVVVYGEGEETFAELVRRHGEESWAEGIAGTAFCHQGQVTKNPPRPLIKDLDRLPFPARDMMDLDRYNLRAEDGLPIYTLLTSRGCPYACTYCYKGVFGSKYRTRSPENVLAEIRYLIDNYDARHLYLGDDIFMLKPDRVRAICDGIINEKFSLAWSCLARVDTVTPDLLALMRQAGCVQIHFGIESGSPEILDRIRKKIDLDKVTQAVAWTRAAGIRSKGYFMAGLPGDTEETLAATLRLAQRLPLDEVMFSLATPFPGTALYDELCRTQGTPDPEAFRRAFYFDDGAGEVRAFFNLSSIDTKKLEAWVREAQRLFRYRKERAAFQRRYGAWIGVVAHLAYRTVGNRWKTLFCETK